MTKYTTLQGLVAAVRASEIDESRLRVVMDNDCSHVYDETAVDEDGCGTDLFEGNGYYDIEELWPLVFPKATVEWC